MAETSPSCSFAPRERRYSRMGKGFRPKRKTLKPSPDCSAVENSATKRRKEHPYSSREGSASIMIGRRIAGKKGKSDSTTTKSERYQALTGDMTYVVEAGLREWDRRKKRRHVQHRQKAHTAKGSRSQKDGKELAGSSLFDKKAQSCLGEGHWKKKTIRQTGRNIASAGKMSIITPSGLSHNTRK